MSMMFCIDAAQLRKAIAEIERAEKNGFKHCLAVFNMTAAGVSLSQCRASYSDLWEKAHPTDGSMDWGRFQRVTWNNKFRNGKLVAVRHRSSAAREGQQEPK